MDTVFCRGHARCCGCEQDCVLLFALLAQGRARGVGKVVQPSMLPDAVPTSRSACTCMHRPAKHARAHMHAHTCKPAHVQTHTHARELTGASCTRLHTLAHVLLHTPAHACTRLHTCRRRPRQARRTRAATAPSGTRLSCMARRQRRGQAAAERTGLTLMRSRVRAWTSPRRASCWRCPLAAHSEHRQHVLSTGGHRTNSTF